MPNDVPGREAERRSPVSSRRSESKRSEGPRPPGLCLLSSALVKIFFQFPLCFSLSLSLSLSLPLSFYITPLLRVINYSIIGDRKRSTYPVGLANKSGGEIFDYFLGFCKQNSYCIAGSRALARVSMKILTQNKFDENYKSCDKRRKVKFGRGIFFEKSSKKRREREKRYRKLGRGSCYSASSNRAASQCSTGTARFVDWKGI